MKSAPLDSKLLDESPVGNLDSNLIDQPHEARAQIGVARRDITPPFGIYGPVWGFSTHDGSSRGTHKPIYATALAITPQAGRHGQIQLHLKLTYLNLLALTSFGEIDQDELARVNLQRVNPYALIRSLSVRLTL